MKITYKFVIVRWLLKSVEKYTQGYLMKSATMLKVMCRCVYILLLIYNTIASPLSLFSNDVELDVYVATWQVRYLQCICTYTLIW